MFEYLFLHISLGKMLRFLILCFDGSKIVEISCFLYLDLNRMNLFIFQFPVLRLFLKIE